MIHDSLCYTHRCPSDECDKIACCDCEHLALVRADERKQAAQRVAESLDNTHRTPTSHCQCEECLTYDRAVAAARGDNTHKVIY